MKGNFEKSKKFRSLIKSDFNIDVVLSNLKYFIQDDLERHQKEKKTCIDFYQAWKKASNFNAFLDCLNSQNFIENNLTTASWLYSHKALTVEVESFLCQEKCKNFMTYADKDANPCVLHLSDVTISGVWNLKEYDCDRNSETLYTLKGAYFVYIEKKTIIFERYRTLEELQKE